MLDEISAVFVTWRRPFARRPRFAIGIVVHLSNVKFESLLTEGSSYLVNALQRKVGRLVEEEVYNHAPDEITG